MGGGEDTQVKRDAGGGLRIDPRVADRVEQGLAVLFYLWFCYRFITAIAAGATDPRVYAVLVVDGIVLVFMLARRPTADISLRPMDWVWALTATLAPLLLVPVPPLAPNLGLALVFAGMAFSLSAKLILRRSFGIVAANRGVKMGGPYRLVRHPMYAGYVIGHIGTLLLLPHMWNWTLFLFSWTAMAMRIRAEERLLTADADYQDYVKRVRYRLVPGLF
ncbi:MAG: isoprenylcysteine carboxylmethyltransferase family protein [Sphingomonadaceae bacterium]|nr:isoprenylcysteine carboxylmethyltransferase family protein [Sphingomonadaceae bacterium]